MQNDMKSILSAFDGADKMKKKSNAGNGDSMKRILESFDNVQENVSVNVTGDSPDEVSQLFKSLNGGTASYDVPTATSSTTMSKSQSSDDDDEMEFGNDGVDDNIIGTLSGNNKSEQSEEYNNEPDEEYQDTDDMVNANSGGINKRKKSYPRAEPGDNPMNVDEERLKKELSKSLKEHMKRAERKNK